MSYDSFVSLVTAGLKERLGKEYVIRVNQITKNNHLLLDGLSVSRSDSSVAPTVYLQDCYERYQNGVSAEKIIRDLVSLYQSCSSGPQLDPDLIARTDFALPRIAFKLIHRASNTELLKEVPYRPVLDLAVVCFLYLGKQGTSHLTSLITRSHLKLWDLGEEDLFRAAFQNTPILFPPRLCSIQDAIGQVVASPDQETGSSSPDFLYLLTNHLGMDGAGAMLYPSVLSDFAQKKGQDLIILPSSIHEVLLLPTDDPDCGKELSRLITQINHTQVSKEERLSNQAYLFSAQTQQLTVLSPSEENSL